MGELMNQVVGDFTGKVRREIQTHITPKPAQMLVLNKQVQLSVDANLDNPEARRVTFYTAGGNIFYLELAIHSTEFIKLHDFDASEEIDPMPSWSKPTEPPPTPSHPAAAAAGTGMMTKPLPCSNLWACKPLCLRHTTPQTYVQQSCCLGQQFLLRLFVFAGSPAPSHHRLLRLCR